MKTPRPLTAKQQRVMNQHQHCQASVEQHGPHWGLYCADHSVWIKWIHKDQVQKVRDLIAFAK
jgi:hypothetical protein